jgi:hypothetical protein
MFNVVNDTAFAFAPFVLPDREGADTLILVAKATFEIAAGRLRVAETQREIAVADEYWGEPDLSSLKIASDVHLPKPGTDVALVGFAHAPGGRSVAEFMFSLSVGAARRTIHVVGDRTFEQRRPTPTARVPLTYENAFGGTHALVSGVLAEERNPVGRGFRGKRSSRELEKLPLPNLLDPREARADPAALATPVGVGFVAPSWQPRRARAGTYDQDWEAKRSPFLPEDFDVRFLQTGSEGLAFERKLQGDEPVEIVNGAPPPHASLRFALPRCELTSEIRIGGQKHAPPFLLETVLFEPEESLFSMTWAAPFRCHNRVQRIEQVKVSLGRMTGVSD